LNNFKSKETKVVLIEVLRKDERVLKDLVPFVGFSELADFPINLAVRPWVTQVHYWGDYFDTLKNNKNAFAVAQIYIPFPQVDANMEK
jgi:small conductance mechanosensitive channel